MIADFTKAFCKGYSLKVTLQGRITSDLRNASFWGTTAIGRHGSSFRRLILSREFYPSGHKINSVFLPRPDWKYDEEKKRFFREKVFRASFPFQMIITIQQLVHLCGNDIHHELTDTADESSREIFSISKGWLDKNMEIAFTNMPKV